MKDFDFRCKRCGGIVLSDEVCPHGNCQNCQVICCEPKSKWIEFGTMVKFIDEINALREAFPELAPELDKRLFDAINKCTPKCGHGNCQCQTMTFEQFHYERNLKFQTLSEAEHYEFQSS